MYKRQGYGKRKTHPQDMPVLKTNNKKYCLLYTSMKFKKDDVVVLTVSGRGDKDVETYLAHKEMAGEYGNF